MRKRRIAFALMEVGWLFSYVVFLQNVFLLLFFSMILISVVSFVYCIIASKKLELCIDTEKTAYAGEKVKIRLELKNHAFWGGFPYEISIGIKNLLTLEEEEMEFSGEIWGKETWSEEVAYRPTRCGCLLITVSKCLLMDAAGIVAFQKKTSVEGRCYVLPQMLPYEMEWDMLSPLEEDAEEYEEWKRGNGNGETVEIREYKAGDNLKRIHWKLSGKLQKLMVGEPAKPEGHDVLLMLDNVFLSEDRRDMSKVGQDMVKASQGMSKAGQDMARDRQDMVKAEQDLSRVRQKKSRDKRKKTKASQEISKEKQKIAEIQDWAAQMICNASSSLLQNGWKHRVAWLDSVSGDYVCYEVGEEETQAEVIKKLLCAGYGSAEKSIWTYGWFHEWDLDGLDKTDSSCRILFTDKDVEETEGLFLFEYEKAVSQCLSSARKPCLHERSGA